MLYIDFTDEEFAAVRAALRRTIDDDKYPLSPRLAPLKAALAKFDPALITQLRPPLSPSPYAGPTRGNRGRARR